MESINNQIKALFLLYECTADLFHYGLPSSTHIKHNQNRSANRTKLWLHNFMLSQMPFLVSQVRAFASRMKASRRLLSLFSSHHFCLSHPTQRCLRQCLPQHVRRNSSTHCLSVEQSEYDFSKGVGPRPEVRGWACSEGSSQRFHHSNVPEGQHGPEREAAMSLWLHSFFPHPRVLTAKYLVLAPCSFSASFLWCRSAGNFVGDIVIKYSSSCLQRLRKGRSFLLGLCLASTPLRRFVV